MTTKHQPATPLPWHVEEKRATARDCYRFSVNNRTHAVAHITLTGISNGGVSDDQVNAPYIAHAANAYPRLVQALQDVVETMSSYDEQGACEDARALLRELGEEGE